tara:strand:+ start:2305 stop:3264 length:960 start_codon:yes stop_codon:yes gene_type:complete
LLQIDPVGGGLYHNGMPIGGGAFEKARTLKPRFVNSVSGQSSVDGYSLNSPCSTLQAAIDLADAASEDDLGSRIIILPNHSETITGAAGLTFDVDGMEILGMGWGAQRPRFLMDAGTSVSALVSGADVLCRNLEFASGHADVVTCFDVTGKGFHLLDSEFGDNTTAENFKSIVKFSSTANTSDGAQILRNRHYTPDAATLGFVLAVDDIKNLRLNDNTIISEGTGLATIITCATGKDLQGVEILSNFLSSKATAGNLAFSNDTASPNNSGIIAHNRIRHADVTGGHVLGVVGGCGMFDNLSVSTDALSGFVIPAIDADS